jgi:hypothetical protein
MMIVQVAMLVREMCWSHRSRQMVCSCACENGFLVLSFVLSQLLQVMLVDENGGTDTVKSKIDNARLGWQQSRHEGLKNVFKKNTRSCSLMP